jgi:hypothetical protein
LSRENGKWKRFLVEAKKKYGIPKNASKVKKPANPRLILQILAKSWN